MTTITIRARWTGNKRIGYRWVAEAGVLTRAQEHASATFVIDTWSSDVDARMTRFTKVAVPVGTLLVEHSDDEWSAAVVIDNQADPIDRTAARHVSVHEVRAGKAVIGWDHVVDVGGERRTFRRAASR